jgi:S1-C subfamily serine protease
MMNMPSVLKLIVAVFFISILPLSVHALTPTQVFDKVKDSVIVVKTLDAQGKVKGQGSGVLLPSGKIATNCHVVEGGSLYRVCEVCP